MVNTQQLQGKWNEIKGRLKEKWSFLTDDELMRAEGNVEQFVGLVQRKTGRAKEEVERFINDVIGESSGVYQRVASAAKEYATEAGQAVRHGYEQAASTLNAGCHDAEAVVRKNPVESVAVTFVAGVAVGIAIALVIGSRSSPRMDATLQEKFAQLLNGHLPWSHA